MGTNEKKLINLCHPQAFKCRSTRRDRRARRATRLQTTIDYGRRQRHRHLDRPRPHHRTKPTKPLNNGTTSCNDRARFPSAQSQCESKWPSALLLSSFLLACVFPQAPRPTLRSRLSFLTQLLFRPTTGQRTAAHGGRGIHNTPEPAGASSD